MNIVFIGMSGSGKTTFGKYCADLLNMPFIDTDREIEKKFGKIEAVFDLYGEEFFRIAEFYEIAEASKKDGYVISVGGGAVTDEKNMRALKEGGLIVYLRCSCDVLFPRLEKDGGRPLIGAKDCTEQQRKDNLCRLISERASLYEKYSDITIDEDEIISRIMAVDGAETNADKQNRSTADFNGGEGAVLMLMFASLRAKLEKKIYPDR